MFCGLPSPDVIFSLEVAYVRKQLLPRGLPRGSPNPSVRPPVPPSEEEIVRSIAQGIAGWRLHCPGVVHGRTRKSRRRRDGVHLGDSRYSPNQNSAEKVA